MIRFARESRLWGDDANPRFVVRVLNSTHQPPVTMKGPLIRSAGISVIAALLSVAAAPSIFAKPAELKVVKYDAANEAEYFSLWANAYGPLELAAGGTLTVDKTGTTVSAVPFHVGADFSVYDHLKYIAISTRSFAVPVSGSLEFSVDIMAQTPGTQEGRVILGAYGPPYSYLDSSVPAENPWAEVAREGQQAGVVLNMVNFETGQLFDWFVSENTVFALIERLPTSVTGSSGTPIEKAYTQIIREARIKPGQKNKVAIRYTRGPGVSHVEYFLNGSLFARVDNVGVPLDVQVVPYTGYAPSLGPGEELKDSLNSFVIGHGLFSLLDAFPYQDPTRPELSVSIPMSERLFGQGAIGNWSSFRVTTRTD
jgi:hypothetical protein